MHLGPTDTGKHPQYNRNYSSSVLKVDADLGWMKESAGSKGGMINPDFIYPGPFYTVAAKANKAGRGKTMVQRGYIRKLTETVYDGKLLGKSYCKFQFNPDVIQRGVQARNDIQYWFNQDASQMSQPIPGDASFGFVLLFNREAEVNSKMFLSDTVLTKGKSWEPPKSIEDVGEMISGKWRQSLGEKVNELSGKFNPAQVTDLGVLIDLMVLDDITGQSISQAAIDAIQTRNDKVAADAKVKADKAAPLTPEELAEAKKDGAKAVSVVTKETLSANIGNTAFLLAQPVRVVFTEWFMVEGYISSINVTFNKFSPDMIPTQCVVDIQMQALYMGFARKDTYLTRIATTVNDVLATGVSSKPDALTPPVVDPDIDFGDEMNAPIKQAVDLWANPKTYQSANISQKKTIAMGSPDYFGNLVFGKKDIFEVVLTLSLNDIDAIVGQNSKYFKSKGITGKLKLRFDWDSYMVGGTYRTYGNGTGGLNTNNLKTSVGGVLTKVTTGSSMPADLTSPGASTPSKTWAITDTLITASAKGDFDNKKITLIWDVTPTDLYKSTDLLRPFENEKFVVSGECTLSIPFELAGIETLIPVGSGAFSQALSLNKFLDATVSWKPGGGPQ